MVKLKQCCHQLAIIAALIISSHTALAAGNNDGNKNTSSDAAITGKVMLQLTGSHGIPSRDIAVNTDNGSVQLCGFVASEKQKKQAAHEASKIDGVKKVINNLILQPAPDNSATDKVKQYTADTATTTKIKTALVSDSDISANDVSVITSYNIVQLCGFVKSQDASAKAEAVATKATSDDQEVKKVINNQIPIVNNK